MSIRERHGESKFSVPRRSGSHALQTISSPVTAKDPSILSNLEQTAPASEFDRAGIADTSTPSHHGLAPVIGKRGLLLLSWLAPVALVIIWEIAAKAGWVSPQ